MSSDPNCEKLREVGAELALGVLPGRERAEAVAHLDRCADCRDYVRQLTGIGDRLIGLLPDREPPLGFETRVARRLARTSGGHRSAHAAGRPQGLRSRARRARLRIAAFAGALAVAVGFAGWAIGTAVEEVTAAPPPAVESEPVMVGDMTPTGRDGRPVGEVYAHPGSPGWIFVSVALTGPGTAYTGTVTCLLERADGTTVRVGDFFVRAGRGDWGVAVPGDLTRFSAARLASPDGTVLATAQLEKGQVLTPEA
ncbi:anti-sigma factor family protein [Streptomyces sp. NPDC048521]|uniref:anti-sigma factor family protein n=1 Tax=Streptomyces sp. NPDC048521 TaxID=3365566 RepID=UPI00371B8333